MARAGGGLLAATGAAGSTFEAALPAWVRAPGLLPLLHALDPALAGELRERLDEVRQRILDIPEPFDAVILSAKDDPRRHRYQALAGEFIGLSGALRRAGERAGVTVTIGGGG